MSSGSHFTTYEEWRHALTVTCGIPLTTAYARERVMALREPSDCATKDFTAHYGEAYLRQVITWFERASREA